MRLLILAPLFALTLLAPVRAEDRKPLEIGQIVSQQNQIRADVLASNGEYRGLSERKQRELLERQDRLLRLLEGRNTTDDLSERERLEAFNALEWIDATISHREDERMVCRNERKTGSKRITRVCRTEAQMREDRERAKQETSRASSCRSGDVGVGCTDW